ncbi:Tetratricopeptide repeat-containing protein [Bryocella elongata]|uniref:Tetratricopeptide repeat-containing protein n=1 Tax=Bryocella elongata TaxID=863522 RepID=A0A1H5TG79_9BACT|nr:tetratricopeptide repeat protein [Bryocella elongata]SEF61816.1 Tetratricopeptide repeat-containing protein [Bryocella elongata]
MTFSLVVPRPKFSLLQPMVAGGCLLLAACLLPVHAAQAQTLKTRTAPEVAAAAQDTPNHSSSYYHYGLARMYEEQAAATGRQDLATQAIEQFKLALDADPDARTLQDGLSNLYFRLGRIREAVSSAQDQVNKHPDDVDAHQLLGRVFLRSLGDGQGAQSAQMLAAAIKEYETIAKLKPKDLETHVLLGQLYGLNHDTLKAEDEFKAAQQIDGNNEDVVLNLARLYSEQGENDKAAELIAAVPEDDRSVRMDFALAGLYDQLHQSTKAVQAYKGALAQDPDNTDAKRGLAQALLSAGQNDEAAKVYADILKSNPEDAQALIREADVQRQKGHYEQALSTLKKAQALASDNLELNYNLALVYDALGRYDEASSTLKQMLKATATPDGKYADQDANNRGLFLDRLGIVSREAGNVDTAVDTYRQMVALGGEYRARGYDGIVSSYRDAHQWAKALDAAAEAAKALPANHDVQLNYASQLGDAGKLDDALKLANAQLTNTPSDREVYFTIADINARARRFKDAEAALAKVETLSTKAPEKVFLNDYRANLAEKQKLYDQAEMDYRKGLAIDPSNASIANDYGYMLADRGKQLDEAVTMLKKAVDFDPQNGAFLDSLAWAYFKQGQYALAEDCERKAVMRMGTDPALHDHLGEIYAHSGKLQQAIAEWQKALDFYATSLAPDADPSDVAKVQKKLEGARVRLAHGGAPTK